jgi:hypothetical protein
MSLICDPNKTPPPSYSARIVQQTNRDIGLSPIFNVNSNIVPCVEDFTSPTYYMSWATKPTTGLTITSEGVYNLSEVDEFDLTFNFTGSTDYTGYTGEFCYALYPSSPGVLFEDCTDYSVITGSSLTMNFNNYDLSLVDNDYIIRTWDKFLPKCITDRRGDPTKTKINTSSLPIVYDDWYMVTVVNPPKPTLDKISVSVFSNIEFVNQIILPEVQGSNTFLLKSSPVNNQVVISVNGISLSTNDYLVENNLITILNGTLESNDVVHAYYNKSISTSDMATPIEELVKLEIFPVTGITTGLTSNFSATTYENIVNYNDTNNRLEIFLKENIDTNVQPILKINGISVAFNIDFFKSNIVNNKLILNEGIELEVGDIVTVYYYYSGTNNPGDLGILNTDTPLISWSTFNNLIQNGVNSNANFVVEITDRSDINYNNILKTGSTIYYNNVSDYTLTVGPITSTSVRDYIYRVRFNKRYVDRYNNVYETNNYSNNGSFRLNWGYINNTKF